ncbi:MAG TPA: hypothetical protein VK492_11625 [Chitinophagaceae bacterium]|nr:hypothetical protein [Chitinophagaceae bacterium]
MVNLKETKYSFNNPVLWSAFIIYIIVSGLTIFHHELWGDELHSWNIAKASNSFFDLISNTRYEGHPPFWYSILWVISKFTHDVSMMQWVQFIIAVTINFLILFASPFPFVTRLLIPFGYFFLYEYAAFSRNYAIGFLIAFSICIILHKNFKYKILLYYTFLFLLANTHLLALVLATGFHIFLLSFFEKKKKTNVVLHLVLGLIVLLPSVYFIFPPADSSLNTDFWLQRLNSDRLSAIIKAPVKAFLPMPAWWDFHFWNTEFLAEAQTRFSFFKWIIGLLSIAILFFTIKIFRKDKNTFFFYLTVLLMFFLISIIIPFANSRQVGFIFIGFLLAYWLFCYNNTISRSQNNILTTLLAIQIIAGIFSVVKEIKYPFSYGYKSKQLLEEIPTGDKIVTDYWCLNTLSAFTDRAYYCIDLEKEVSYLLWDGEMTSMLKKNDRYSNGLLAFLKKELLKKVYMISIYPLERLYQSDKQLPVLFNIDLIDKKEGAIEKGSNLYLYEINSK